MSDINITNLIETKNIRKYVGIIIDEFDDELILLGNTAIKKLIMSGILSSKINSNDSVINNTILAYIKANFRNTQANIADRYKSVFEENKDFMRSTKEYTEVSSDG